MSELDDSRRRETELRERLRSVHEWLVEFQRDGASRELGIWQEHAEAIAVWIAPLM